MWIYSLYIIPCLPYAKNTESSGIYCFCLSNQQSNNVDGSQNPQNRHYNSHFRPTQFKFSKLVTLFEWKSTRLVSQGKHVWSNIKLLLFLAAKQERKPGSLKNLPGKQSLPLTFPTLLSLSLSYFWHYYYCLHYLLPSFILSVHSITNQLFFKQE